MKTWKWKVHHDNSYICNSSDSLERFGTKMEVLDIQNPSDPPGQLNVPGEEGDPLSMDGAQVSIRQ